MSLYPRLRNLSIFQNIRSLLSPRTSPSGNCTRASYVSGSNVTGNETVDTSSQLLDKGLTLTESCIKRLHHIASKNEPYLRITISGGGCSGFQYQFEMDSKVTADDRLIADNNGKPLVVVDSTSLSYVAGSTIDYYEELIRTGFRIISNPQADGGCSCGASFSIKM